MKKLYILVLIFFGLNTFVYGQFDIAADDCHDAIELTNLDDFCDRYFEGTPTYDAGTSNCADPPTLPNVWFKFTTQGPNLELEAILLSGEEAVITVGRFMGDDCESQFGVVDCSVDGKLEINGLPEGIELYISIAFNPSDPNSLLSFCIDNPNLNAPPNDDPCDAIAINANGGCQSGTTVDANPDWGGGCDNKYFQNSVYYKTTISPGNNNLTATLSGLPEGVVAIMDFNGNCNSQPTMLAVDCGPAPIEISAAVEEGGTYYILVSTSNDDASTFTVCLEESGPPPGCSENDLCANAKDFGTSVHDAPAECLDGCNIGGTADFGIQGCFPGDWISSYFSFRTDNMANRATIVVDSDDPSVGAIAVALMVNCTNPTIYECEQGGNGYASLDGVLVQPNTNYIIMVATPPGGTGEYDVCLQTFRTPDNYCVGRDVPADTSRARLRVTHTSMGSPKSGPYEPEEEITYEYYVPNYSATSSAQWLQGIVPIFGTGWDPASFDSQGKPLISNGPNSHGATWNWYPDGNVAYTGTSIVYTVYTDTLGGLGLCYYTDPMCPNTGITAGQGLPAGWFAARPGGPCQFNGHPSTGYGDGLTGPWTVTFTLKVRPLAGPESCTETGYIDCSVKMFTFGDEQTGCWYGASDPNACSGDEYRGKKGITNCCQGPEVDEQEQTICSGEQTSIELTSDMDPDVTYTWVANAPSTVTGAADGSGRFITQKLTNTSNSPKIVIYTVTGTYGPNSCPGQPVDIIVEVLPEVVADAGDPIDGCAQVDFTLGGTPTASGGAGQFTYQWNNGAGTDPNPTVQVNTTTTFRVTVTDEYGCEATDEVTIEVMDAVLFSIEGETEFCENTSTELSINPISGELPYSTWEWQGPGGFYSQDETVEVFAPGTYTVTITDANGCEGEGEVLVEMIDAPYILIVPEEAEICPGYSIDIQVMGGTYTGGPWTSHWQTPDGEREERFFSTWTPGTYTVTVTDEFGCQSIDSITVVEAEVPVPQIMGDSVICDGNFSVLSLEEEYMFYSWSTGETSKEIAVSTPGEYSVTVTAIGTGCAGEGSFTVAIDESTIAFIEEPETITCVKQEIQLSAEGSSVGAQYEYQWSTADGNIVEGGDGLEITVDNEGTYTLTVTNTDSGCEATYEVTVEIDTEEPVANAGDSQDFDCATTSIKLDGSGSSSGGNFTYEWTTEDGAIASGASSTEASVTSPGEYTLTVVNEDNGCIAEDVVVIGENVLEPEIDSIGDVTLTCIDSEITISANASTQGNAIYSWTSTTDNIVGNADEQEVTVNKAGVLTLIITDDANSCASTIDVTILEDQDEPTANAGDEMTLTCDIESVILDGNGSSVGAEYAYLWTTTDGNIISDVETLTPEVNADGTYLLTVTNTRNGCVSTDEVVVNLDENYPDVDAGETKELTCVITEVQLDASAGTSQGAEYTYLWTTTDGNIIEGADGLKPLVDEAGTYKLVVTNTESGCVESGEVLVTINTTEPDAVVADAEEFGCDTESMTLSGAGSSTGADYTYSWTGNPGNVVSGGNTLQPEIGEPGTYILVVTDIRNGCTAQAQVVVGQSSDLPRVDAGENKLITCDVPEVQLNGSASSEVGGTLDYHWNVIGNGNIVSGGNTLTPIVDAPGFYELYVIDLDNGCENTSTIEVRDSIKAPAIAAAAEYILTCNDPQVELDATNGTASSPTIIYHWITQDGNIIGDPDRRRATVDEAGTYTFIVKDEFTGCMDSVDFVVVLDQGYPVVEITGMDTLTCSTESITLDASQSSQGADFVGTWTASNGGEITGDENSYTLEVTKPGRYTFEVVNTANGCLESSYVDIEENKTEPEIEKIDNLTLTCAAPEGTVTASVTTQGEAIYKWTSSANNIVGPSDEASVNVNGAGVLTLTVTDAENGCSTSVDVTVIEDMEAPIADAGPDMTLTCDATTVTLDGSNSSIGSQYTYAWSSPDGGNIVKDGNTLSPQVDVAGTYILTVTNTTNGCTATSEVTVGIDENLPQIKFETVQKLTCARTVVTIDASNSSNGPEYSYNWTTQNGKIESENGLQIEVSKPGTYILTITNNDNDCVATSEVTIEEDIEKPFVSIAQPDILDCVQTSVEIDGSASDSGSGYKAQWTTQNGRIVGPADEYIITVDKVGDYVLTITNIENGCTQSETVRVEASEDTPVADAGPDLILTCVDTVLTINAGNSSSGSDFSIDWYSPDGNFVSGEKTLTPVVNSGGMYILTITNTSNNCVASDTMHVTVDQEYPEIALRVSNEINCSNVDAVVNATISNATQYTIEWYYEGAMIVGENAEELRVTEGGRYSIKVENSTSSCYSMEMIEVIHNTNVIQDAEITTVDPSCQGDETGCVVINNIIGGEAPYSIYVDGTYRGTLMKVCGLSVGEHTLLIEDKNGCTMEFEFEINPAGEYYVSIGETYEVAKGDSIELTFTSNIPKGNIESIRWEWLLDEEIPCNTCDTILIAPEKTTKVFITVTDINGCVFEAFANVLVRKMIKVYVPTAFTPNGDGTNDVLTVYADKEITEILRFEIYDRWGELVFMNKNFKPNDEGAGWDGTWRGEPMQPDVFMYKVEALMEDDSKISVKGTSTLML